jgi:hypothetical protein
MISEDQLVVICNSDVATERDLNDALRQINEHLNDHRTFIHACVWYQEFMLKIGHQKNQLYLQQNISAMANLIYPPLEKERSFGFNT